MSEDSPKHLQQRQQQQAAEQQQTRPQERVFETPEELLRHDAAQTNPPASIEARLKDSIAKEPPASPSPWWRRWLGR
jgi:hypothetical protein